MCHFWEFTSPTGLQASHRSSDNAVDTSADVQQQRLPAMSTSGNYPPQPESLKATAQHTGVASSPPDNRPPNGGLGESGAKAEAGAGGSGKLGQVFGTAEEGDTLRESGGERFLFFGKHFPIQSEGEAACLRGVWKRGRASGLAVPDFSSRAAPGVFRGQIL